MACCSLRNAPGGRYRGEEGDRPLTPSADNSWLGAIKAEVKVVEGIDPSIGFNYIVSISGQADLKHGFACEALDLHCGIAISVDRSTTA
jgi:hypothetical protein